MEKNPNADYHKLISEKDAVQFSELYEQAITNITTSTLDFSPSLIETLKQKRKFGLEKYKEDSFQANLTNAINSPVFNHLADELVDSFNYATHLAYTAGMRGDKEAERLMEGVMEGLMITSSRLALALRHSPVQSGREELRWLDELYVNLLQDKKEATPVPAVEQKPSSVDIPETGNPLQVVKIPLAWALQKNPQMADAYKMLQDKFSATHTPDVTDPNKPFAVRYCKCGSDNLILEIMSIEGKPTYRYVCADCQCGKASIYDQDHFQAAKNWAAIVEGPKE